MLRGLAWQTVIVSMQQSNHGMLQKHYSMQQDLLDPGATLFVWPHKTHKEQQYSSSPFQHRRGCTCIAVRDTIGSAAACSKDMLSGILASKLLLMVAYSA